MNPKWYSLIDWFTDDSSTSEFKPIFVVWLIIFTPCFTKALFKLSSLTRSHIVANATRSKYFKRLGSELGSAYQSPPPS